MEVRDIMTRDVTTASPGMPLREAADILIRRRLRAVPVIDDEAHVLGILTDGQLMTRFLPVLEAADAGDPVADAGIVTGNVRDIMERTVMCVNEDEPLANVIRLMLDKQIERFPVVREGRLAGFLTRGDIIRRLLRRGVTEGAGGAETTQVDDEEKEV